LTNHAQFQEELQHFAAEILKAKLPDHTIVENLKMKGPESFYAEGETYYIFPGIMMVGIISVSDSMKLPLGSNVADIVLPSFLKAAS
jgi:hypothetical protein